MLGVLVGLVLPWVAVLVFIALDAYFLWPQQRTPPTVRILKVTIRSDG